MSSGSYSTRKRTKEAQANVALLAELGKLSQAITDLRDATVSGLTSVVTAVQESGQRVALVKEQVKRCDKHLEKALECLVSMDESLLDMAVDKELVEQVDLGTTKKKRTSDGVPHEAREPGPRAQDAPAAHKLPDNQTLFFTVTDLLPPPALPPQ